MERQIVPLVGTGGETVLKVRDGQQPMNWQIQNMDGKPMTMVDHFGKRRGDRLTLPAIERHLHYQVVLVYV